MHEGHRQRMLEKLSNPESLYDQELLEVLLYNVIPRSNTNPLAHLLLDRFVSISEVFAASIEELKEVDGVGDATACFLKTVGLCAERAGKIGNAPTLKTMQDCKRFADMRLRGKSEEFAELYFVDRAYRVRRIFSYTTAEKSRVAVNPDRIARDMALFRPYGVIIAHNHVDGTKNPSDYDDEFTHIVQFICNMNDCKLLDHLVYLSRDDIFSYKDEGRLDKVKNLCNWETFRKWIITLN